MKVKLSQQAALFLMLILATFGCKRSDPVNFELLQEPLNLELSPDKTEEAFKNAGYNAFLFESIGFTESIYWRPLWEKAEIREIDSITYQYVRLRPEGAHNSKLKLNVVKYIVRTISDESDLLKSEWQIATYISKVNPGTTNENIIPSFAKFTGYLQTKNLKTKETRILEYIDGKRIIRKPSGGVQARGTVCVTQYACTWNTVLCDGTLVVLYLIQDNTWWKPNDPPCTMQDSGWTLVESQTLLNCHWVDDPPPPGGGGGDNGGGGGDNTGTPPITQSDMEQSTLYEDNKPKITNLQKYLDCFGDGKQTDHYKLTIYVDQPVSEQGNWFRVTFPVGSVVTNNPYNVPTGITWVTPGGQLFDVGHTFVSFEKHNTDGSIVRQVLGFYPGGFPIMSTGAIKDDSGHSYDASYSMNVTQGQFNAALSSISLDHQTQDYVLFNSPVADAYNCTDAALSWINAAGANLTGGGTLPFNNTPGQFGQVLRNATPGANPNGGSAPDSKGPCN